MPARKPSRLRILLITATALLVPTAIVTATVRLTPIADMNGAQLAKLSAIGEAFGAVSAALSAIALIGIATSLYFQMQQTRVARIEASRTMRLQLMQFALGKPRYLAAWGFDLNEPQERNNEMAYTSMVFAYLKMSYVLGVLTDFELSRACRVAFRQKSVADFWRGAREVYLRDTFSAAGRRFARLIDEAYLEVTRELTGQLAQVAERREVKSTPKPAAGRRAAGVAVAIGVSVGVLVEAMSTKRTRRDRISGRKDRS